MDGTAAYAASDRIADIGNSGQKNDTNDVRKTKLKPHLKKQWVIPPKQNAEVVAKMEDILEIYALPYDEEIPLICMDEQPVQLCRRKA